MKKDAGLIAQRVTDWHETCAFERQDIEQKRIRLRALRDEFNRAVAVEDDEESRGVLRNMEVMRRRVGEKVSIHAYGEIRQFERDVTGAYVYTFSDGKQAVYRGDSKNGQADGKGIITGYIRNFEPESATKVVD